MEKTPEKGGAMDPRRKDSQGLDVWAEKLLAHNVIGRKTFDDFVSQNNRKEERMKELGLPQLRHYGLFESPAAIREKLDEMPEDELYIIRCRSKSTGEIKRLLKATREEVYEFAEGLPGGFDEWNVEVKEFALTKAAGTIVISPSGRSFIEEWRGEHFRNVENGPKYRADFDPDQFDMHFRWQAPDGAADLPEMQEYAIKALRYVFPNLKPEPNQPMYLEYGVKESGDIYFIEANNSSILTGKE